jgi:hypothetical protein
MKNLTMKLEVEIEGRTIEFIQKERYEIEDCEEGNIIRLQSFNGDVYTGIFKGMDEMYTILLKSLTSEDVIGLDMQWVSDYFEECPTVDTKTHNSVYDIPSQGTIDMMNGGWEKIQEERMSNVSWKPIYNTDDDNCNCKNCNCSCKNNEDVDES